MVLRLLSAAMLLVICSCADDQTANREKETLPADTSEGVDGRVTDAALPDTIKKLIVDDYPITDDMLEYGHDPMTGSMKLVSGKIVSLDKAWFSNDTLQQTLVFELYTDYHRMATFHFINDDIPGELISTMQLHADGGELADDRQKEKYFNGFLDSARRVDASCFITDKGFKLGDNKEDAVEVYGTPDSVSTLNDVEKYVWNYVGDAFYDGRSDLKGKPLAGESYGHQVVMFFRNNRLTGIILHNDIP